MDFNSFREAQKQEHELVLAYGKRLHRLVVGVVVGCVIVLALSVAAMFFVATTRPNGWETALVLMGIWCLFLLVGIVKKKDYKYKAIVAREYQVGEAKAVSKERIHHRRSLEHYVVLQNPDGSMDKYLIEKWTYKQICEGGDCLLIKFNREGQRGLAYTRSVVAVM